MGLEDELIHQRHKKLEQFQAQGVEPFGRRFDKPQSIAQAVAKYRDGAAIQTAGRLSAKRLHGKFAFADLRDATGKLQLHLSVAQVGPELVAFFDMLDLGDIVGVRGTFFTTKTGEITIEVEALELLAKSLRPLPEKWHGLKDQEVRYRRRYLDLIANETVRRTFQARAQVIRTMRGLLESRGFLEVETPMMQPIPGGAAGEPFTTRHAALNLQLYLRLAPELYLKRLLVGGFDKVYELNRSFRNEGLSTRHNPEFTMLEAYAAYDDCRGMMALTKDLITAAAQAAAGRLQLTYQGQPVDLSGEWRVVSFDEAMRAHGLTPQSSASEIAEALTKRGIKVQGLNRSQLVRLVEQLFHPQQTAQPLFVIDYWTSLSPLAKAKPGHPELADRFELYIGGMEVANAYSELNDPIEQRKRFEEQLEERSGLRAQGSGQLPIAQSPQPRAIDEDFVEALEYGMPPAGGLGIGIDRLTMLLTDQPSIKDVILFPLLKPENA